MKKHITILIIGILICCCICTNTTGKTISIKDKKIENNYAVQISSNSFNPLPFNYKKTDHKSEKYVKNFENILMNDVYDYVIISTSALESAIISSEFISWKESIGFKIKIVKITDSEITSQIGVDLPQKIRNFLREYQYLWGIKFVLIIGDHNTIPMRYCYPDPTNHKFTAGVVGGDGGDVPTDYYYADLSEPDENSWDLDGDGYYGEYNQDEPDFQAEVFVGRIPTSIPARVTYTLDKTVNFEKDKGDWKNSALHAGAFFYFEDELGDEYPTMDGAKVCNEIEENIMGSWEVSHYSEQAGLEKSVYPWSPLSKEAYEDDWGNGKYAIINWAGHGWSDGAYRKIWSSDDGDGKPENPEFDWIPFIHTSSNLDDDYPSIVFAISCVIAYPEPNQYGQIGVDLLTKQEWGASIGVIASTRYPWGSVNWPGDEGGCDAICYEFNRFLITEGKRVGEALFESKYYCNQNYAWDIWQEYNNLYVFNLYGDPSLVRTGVSIGEPNTPTILGKISGIPSEEYEFTLTSTDPENDDIYYYIDWGDGQNTGWVGPYDSGEEIKKTHSWIEKAQYTIKAKCKDINDFESGWGYLKINIPRNKTVLMKYSQNILYIILKLLQQI